MSKTLYVGPRMPWAWRSQAVSDTEVAVSMSIDETLRRAGLNWDVAAYPAAYQLPDGSYSEGMGQQIVRLDTGVAIGAVGDKYVPVSNNDLFGPLQKLLDQGLAQGVVTAGTLNGGRKVWMQLILGEGGVSSEDRSVRLASVLASHDGSTAISVGRLLNLYVVCANTFAMALSRWRASQFTSIQDRDAEALRRITHTVSAKDKLHDIVKALIEAEQASRELDTVGRILSEVDINTTAATMAIVDAVLSDSFSPDELAPKKNTRFKNRVTSTVDGVLRQWHTSPGATLASRDGTAWGLFNAVTSYLDYPPDGLRDGETVEDFVGRLWFNAQASLRETVLDSLMDKFVFNNVYPEREEVVRDTMQQLGLNY